MGAAKMSDWDCVFCVVVFTAMACEGPCHSSAVALGA